MTLLNVALLDAALWALGCSTLAPTLLRSYRQSLLCTMTSGSVIILGSLKNHRVLLGFDSVCIIKIPTLVDFVLSPEGQTGGFEHFQTTGELICSYLQKYIGSRKILP